jgi:hypothetical protein
MTKSQYALEKAMVERSRQIVMHKLSIHRVPMGCERCDYVERCATRAPGRAVLCELDDDEAMVTLPEPGLADYEKCVEENASYYLQVHVLGVK